MRYKKKKRQIISAALAAMMAMQLCIPSATFAAVPAKKLKVITGFTELPEEVAHIQIPADAGENFEDYLNFPETIEASVVEYKNVDHQKNNADRDKGAEDEKTAADDSDKKEDFGIATGSNAKKENLNEEETPETENSENMPDSNDEEEADKQEVQEKDLQKDQQGTFLIATDSNAGDFLEDYEFEDEKISEDIPVLTDISVTWELDENREDESGFYYYLPVLPREYILAAGVELPEIEVSMDGGIALLASTDTYNIADGGIVINSDTLEQYNDATITGSSTTHNILVNGVEATITISDLDIQIPIDNNATTTSNWIPAIRLANGAKLNLILKGKNTLKGGDMCAAIEVPEGCTLTISGEGSLKATGGGGAGIGASSMRKGSLGTIEINGGNIEAYGSGMAAGIGGGLEGGIGTIVINGGTVYAKGGYGSYPKDIKNVYGGAGIGGGANGCVDRIEINGGNVTAYGGYATNAGRHPGAAIGTGGGGAKPIGEGKYKYGEIEINGGTVSAIAYHNEVYAIGIGVKPGQALQEGTLVGSISISDQAVVNLNGGDYFPKSENSGLKNYTIQGTIADVRFTESTYPVTISVGEITWDAGMMKVSDYQGTLKASNYLKPLTIGKPVTVQVTVGDYVYQMEADVADVDDKNATITLKAGTPLYETRLKFVSTVITSDQILQATDITVKQNDKPLSNQEGQSAAMVIPSMQISYDEANTGHLTVYLPENRNKTEISVTVPGLNDGNPITKSGETISTTTLNEIEMFHDDTVCSHEHYNADGFCEACGAYQEPKNWKGYYEIYNAGQLFWFAKQFNDGQIPNKSNLKLMKDIKIPDGHDWTSIGNIDDDDKSFKGTIEGNYHVISGLRPANDGTSFKYGLVATIKYGNVQNIGLVFEGDWTCGLCRLTVGDIKIQNCFVVGTNFSYSCSQGAVTKNGTVTNCLAVSGKLEGTKYSNDHRATFTNCYETTKSDYSSPGITTLDNEEKLKKLKSGEIAYKLNGNQSDGTWGQVIGTEDYPHFRKYSKTVYYDSATGTYSNNQAASISSATVTDIKTISETQATATLKATGTPGAEVKFLLTSGEDERTLTLDDMFSNGTPLRESSSGNYECTITDLAPDTEYHVRLMIKKEGKLSLDVTYVNFRTEKVQQEAPKAADVSINYEQETLENKASCDLEYVASKDAQSWTTIRQGAKVRLTGLLDNIRENGGSVPFYIRKKASSSMSASEAVLVADLQTQAIPEESNKPNIDYRKEEITISSSLQYVIVNGANTSPSWTSAKMGSGSGISITDIISSDHESTVYYRYAASSKDKKFAGKPESITIPKRTAAPAAITENEVDITGTTITINRTNPENDIEYGYRDVDSDGAFTWIDGTKIQGLYPAHGYQVTSRIKAKENAFASERTEPLNVSTKDTLRIVGNGTQKWNAKGTYGGSLAKIPVSLASGYGVYNGANQLVAGTWSWEPENSSSASGIYPKVKGNKAYTVKFTPTDSSASYDGTLTASVVPEISKYTLQLSVAVEDKTYDGTKTATVHEPLIVKTGVYTGSGEEQLQITGLTAAFLDVNAGTNKKVVIDASNAVITGAVISGGATADPDNYQVNIPSSATATIEKAASSITINDAEWPGTKTYGDPDFPLTGVTTVGDGAVTKTSDSANVLTVDADGRATIHGAGTATVTISVASGTNYTTGNNSRPITVQKGTISLNLKAGKKTGLMQRLLEVLGNVEDTYVLTLEAKGAYQDVLAGTVIFYENGQQLNQTPLPLTNGTASMEYSVPSAGTHEISAEYVLPADGSEKENYNDPAQVSCSFEVEKADEDQIKIKEVDGKLYGDDPFELEVTGQKGTGAVKFSVPADNGVLELSEVNGKTEAKIIGAGTVLVTAEVAGDTGYNGTTVTREITIGKAQTPEVSVAAPKIAPVPADAPEEVKEIANLLEEKTPEITGLDIVAADLIRETENGDVIVKTGEDQTISGAEAKEKLQKEGVDTAGKKVRLVVEPYMSVEVKGVTEKQGVNVITFEITALYNVKATTAGKNETMQEEGTGRNTILIGTAIPQKVGTPVTITLPLPADYSTEDLFIRHLLHSGKIAYYPVTVKKTQGSVMAEFVNKDGFSTFELLSDSRKGTVAFDNGVGERSYTLEQMDEALPTVSKDGAVFKGWKINGTLYTTVNEALLDALDQAEGHRVTAQAVLESSSPETPDNPKEDDKPGSETPDDSKGDRNTGSDSDREDTDRNVARNAWKTKKVNGVVRWSYYDSDGRRVFNVWKQLLYEGIMFWYHFGTDGYMDTGWFKDADGNWYYLNQASDGTQGTMKTGWFKDTDGNWYYLNPVSDGTRGAMKTGWFKDADGNWYYLNPVSDGTQGAMKTGWFTDPQDGHLYYLDPKTGAMVTGNIQNDSV